MTIRATPNIYTVQFKLNVLQFMQRTDASYHETGVEFRMRSHYPIIRLKNDIESEGVEVYPFSIAVSAPSTETNRLLILSPKPGPNKYLLILLPDKFYHRKMIRRAVS